MNDPHILYNIARFADTNILLNLVRASLPFRRLVAENSGVRYDLMDHYAIGGIIKCTDGTKIRHGIRTVMYLDQNLVITNYYRANKIHRDGDLPAIIWSTGNQYWYQNDQCHRNGDQPAVIRANGGKEWCKNNLFHRDNDLPAIITDKGNQHWYQHGKQHRNNGQPAIIWANGDQEWWVNGIRVR